ncbi:hypothetical protein ACFY0R_10755 [Streptomyces sp. NPDC001633]|uniref:hypothetical protein n=1 Tax=Streptomyces sp. NPDC001633 TaxID=3364595 RepID=UPI003674F8AB
MVGVGTSGNITRAPERSVSAPTGTPSREPTGTRIAIRADTWTWVRSRLLPKVLPSGAMRFHAQKVIVKPRVATARFR